MSFANCHGPAITNWMLGNIAEHYPNLSVMRLYGAAVVGPVLPAILPGFDVPATILRRPREEPRLCHCNGQGSVT